MISELQKKIVEEMHVKPEIDPKEEIRKTIDFMKDYLKKHSFIKTYVLGISGGQDSVLLGRLTQMTMEEMREETGDNSYRFIALSLPYGEDDTKEALEWVQADETLEIDIKPAVDAQVEALEKNGMTISEFNKGNIKARQRMIAHYGVAGDRSGIVIGTDHPAENVTGYFTKYGDGGTDIVPLFRLNKRQGADLLKKLNAPEIFYKQTPTAGLEDDGKSPSDEEEMGVSYDAIDDYLEGKEVSDKDRETIEKLYKSSEHKRHLPVTIFHDFWK